MLERFHPASALGLRAAPLSRGAALLLACACSDSATIITPGAPPASEPSTAVESNRPAPPPPAATPPAARPTAGVAGVAASGAQTPSAPSEGNGGAPALQPPSAGAAAPNAPEPPPGQPAEPPRTPPPRVCEPAEGKLGSLQLTPMVDGLFQPTFVTAAPGDDSRLFVL